MNNEDISDSLLPDMPDKTSDGLLPVTVFCAMLGMLFGPVPAVLFTFFSGHVFFPLFIVPPLLMLLMSRLLKGSRRRSAATLVIAVFSLAGAYFTALSCQAALYVMSYEGLSLFSVPLLTILSIFKAGVLPNSASFYIYALLFTALGVVIDYFLIDLDYKGRRYAKENLNSRDAQ